MNDLFWEDQWKKKYDERLSNIRSNPEISYWDKRAKDFSAMRKSNNYDYGRKVRKVFNEIITEESSILDIGAGPGSFVIPFAQDVQWVTAVEPSKEMIKLLNENASELNISNYDIIDDFLENVSSDLIKNKYDLVTVSLVLWMFRDVWPEILKMENISKRYCAIVAGVPDKSNLHNNIAKNVSSDGRCKSDVEEFQILYNLLFSKGRRPNVMMIDYKCERSIEDEINCQKIATEQYDCDLTLELENKIREEVVKKAVDGKCLVCSKSAVIWWDKENKLF